MLNEIFSLSMNTSQAVVLSEYMFENSDLVKGKRVLELGAGTGLAGLVAASLGKFLT